MRPARPDSALCRALCAVGIQVEVAAPSKLQKPAGERVNTDANNAIHLAKLLQSLEQITAVAIVSADEEAARDLARARKHCRSDLWCASLVAAQRSAARTGVVGAGGT